MVALWSRRCQVRTLNKRTVDCPIIGKCTEKAVKEKDVKEKDVKEKDVKEKDVKEKTVKEKTVKEKTVRGVRDLSRKFLVLFLFLGTSDH